MVPAAVADQTIKDILPHLEAGDILIDGGNSYYVDDIRRAKELAKLKIHYADVGTSGGVWGLERGYCMMIENDVIAILIPSSHARGRHRRYFTHPRPRKGNWYVRTGIPALWTEWRRSFCEDGAQRN
jgi:hypothetical protein